MGKGWYNQDPNETGSTRAFRAEPRGGNPSKIGTAALTQDSPSRDLRASEGSIGRIHRGRSSQGVGGGSKSIPRHTDTNPTGPDRRGANRTGRANGGTNEGVANTTSRPHSQAHLFSYPSVLGTPFLFQTARDHCEDPLQGSRTGAKLRLPVSSPTPVSVGTDTHDTPEVSGSIRSADKGMESTSLTPRVTRSTAKQTPRSSPWPKRPFLSPSKGSSSKRRR